MTDMHVLSDELWSTERHTPLVGAFKGGPHQQILLQGSDDTQDTYWVDLRGAL